MTVLTAEQVYAYARSAGLGPAAATIATAIALAESGGRTDARGDVDLTEPGEVSVGLWQVNYRPSRDAGNPQRDPQANLDPATNAKAMAALSRTGRSWQPWSTYTASDTPYLRHTKTASAASQAVESSGGGASGFLGSLIDPFDLLPGIGADGGVTDKLNPLDGIPDAIRGGVDSMVAGGSRLMLTGLLVLGGVALVAAGLVRGVAPAVQSRAGGATDLATTAAMATPQGRAAGVASAASKGSA
jgi:hypothetical protein